MSQYPRAAPVYAAAPPPVGAMVSHQQPGATHAPSTTNQQTAHIGMKFQKSYAMTAPGGKQPVEHGCYEGMMRCLGACAGSIGAVPCCLCQCCCPNPFQQVYQGTVGLITRFGRFVRAVDPGLYKIDPYCERLQTVDIRMRSEDIPRQYILTKDNVGVVIDSVLYWCVEDPYVATFLVENVRQALIDRTQTTLRQVLGSRTLQDCLEHRDSISQEIRDMIDSVAEQWGVQVESILLRDMKLGAEMMESLSAAAKQRRVGESKVIGAQAEVAAAKLMREAADILNAPAAMQIRYLETMQTMASTAGAKVIFMPAAEHGAQMSMKDATILEGMAGHK